MFIFVLTVTLTVIECSDILVVVPTPLFSHQSAFRPLWKELSHRGHNVTLVTTHPMRDPDLHHIKEIDLSVTFDFLRSLNSTAIPGGGWFSNLQRTRSILNGIQHTQFSSKEMQELIQSKNQSFDLVIVEAMLPAFMAFSWKYKCPFIGVATLDADTKYHESLGNPTHPVLYPHKNMEIKEDTLDFFDRVTSVWFYILQKILDYLDENNDDRIVAKYFGEHTPLIRDIQNNMSMMFITTNPLFHSRRALMPNTITVGNGIHIQKQKPLPKDLKRYLDKATVGVIYVSFGTFVRSFEEQFLKHLLKSFSELPYQVLFKTEATLNTHSDNVRVEKFLPQQDVLGHPNVKLFITQGGLQSLQEALFNNIPIIGIPFVGDQNANVQKLVLKGCGLKLNPSTFTSEILTNTILEAMENSSYRETAKKMGDIFRDVEVSSLESAVWWTEYVIRHNGAEHWKSLATEMPFWKYYMLDVLLFVGVILYTFTVLTMKTIFYLIRA